jgi:hypothetical protein
MSIRISLQGVGRLTSLTPDLLLILVSLVSTSRFPSSLLAKSAAYILLSHLICSAKATCRGVLQAAHPVPQLFHLYSRSHLHRLRHYPQQPFRRYNVRLRQRQRRRLRAREADGKEADGKRSHGPSGENTDAHIYAAREVRECVKTAEEGVR